MEQFKIFLKRWSIFFRIILSPGSVIPLLLMSFCLYLSIFIYSGSFSNLLSVTASILGTIAGIFIKEDWDAYRGNSMLEKKGRSAIRNLESIGHQVIQIRGWIKSFVSNKN